MITEIKIFLDPAETTGYDYPKPTNGLPLPTKPAQPKPAPPSVRTSTQAPTYLPPATTPQPVK